MYAENKITMKWRIGGVAAKIINKLNKKEFMKVRPTFIGCIGMINKNLIPNLKFPLTTVANTYTTKRVKRIEEMNLAIVNSKKTIKSFKNSLFGLSSITISR